MFDNLNTEWWWVLVGFIVGVTCSWFVCDLVFPIKKKDRRDD